MSKLYASLWAQIYNTDVERCFFYFR